MRLLWDTWIMMALAAATATLALVMALTGNASWLEAVSFVTGAAAVWLTVRENVWNFPIGILNVATFSVVFFRAGLFADAGLQVVYFILGFIGWYLWLFGGERHTALRITRTGATERAAIIIGIVVMTLVLWRTLRYAGGSASFWDALTTAMSLGAQWLLNRKRLENWTLWIVVDVIYIPLYLYKGLYLTAVLYAVFLGMAIIGLMKWSATWRRQHTPGLPVLAGSSA
jgi:nicotinamide mononucleotide transporter